MRIRKAIFLSHLINERTPFYGGKRSIVLKKIKSIKKGDPCNTMFWSFSNHIGTHIDAPLHFIDNGKSVSGLSPLDLVFDKVQLIRLENIKPGHVIEPADLSDVHDCDLLLIKTGSEINRNKEIYWRNSVSMSPVLAGWLKRRCHSLKAVGIDSISISNLNKKELGHQAHRAFLGGNILLIEDMKLGGLKDNPDLVIVAPMLTERADGSPCTILGIYN